VTGGKLQSRSDAARRRRAGGLSGSQSHRNRRFNPHRIV
jgi:hypothetical protein